MIKKVVAYFILTLVCIGFFFVFAMAQFPEISFKDAIYLATATTASLGFAGYFCIWAIKVVVNE